MEEHPDTWRQSSVSDRPSDDRQDREKVKAVELAVGQIEKQFGKGSIMRLGQKGPIQPIDAIPTGAISIDYALGVGGVPRGRVIEIFGPESSGKTTLALQVIAEAQKLGGMAAFVDAEHALDAAYALKLGVDLDNLLVSQPDNGEQALEIVEVLIRSGGVDVVVVDSVAALVPKAEIEGEMGDAQMGLQARLMSQALRKLTGVVSKSKTSLIFINQLREKIGVMFGNPETTTGGRALKFYASVRIDIRRIASIKDGDAVIGGRTRVKVVKNKVAPPFREAEFDVMYGEGISRTGDLLDLAVDKRIIEKSGAWFAYGGERLGQGRENAKQFLKDNPAVFKTIEDRVRRELGLTREATPNQRRPKKTDPESAGRVEDVFVALPFGLFESVPPDFLAQSMRDDEALVTIAEFATVWEASMARGALEAAGIRALVPEEMLVRSRTTVYPFGSLQVLESDSRPWRWRNSVGPPDSAGAALGHDE